MLRRIHGPDHGASYIEYAAVIMLVAAIASVVMTAGIPGRVSGMITDALDAVANGGQTQSQADGPADSPADSGSDDPPKEPSTQGQDSPDQGSQGDKGSQADKEGKESAPAPKDEPWWSPPGVDIASLTPDPPDLKAPLGLGDPAGLTSSLLPGGGQLKTVGLSELTKKFDHDFYVDAPDLKLSDLHPNLMPLPDGEAPDGWWGEQIESFDKQTGKFVTDTVEGLSNTLLHPQEAARQQGEQLIDVANSYYDHAKEYGTRLAHAPFADDPVKAHLDVVRDAGQYFYIDAPWSAGKLIVNESARESFAKGDYGGGISQVSTSVGSLIPPVKALRVMGNGPEKPSPTPPKPDPDKQQLAGKENKPDTGQKNGSDKPSCKRNSFVAGTPVLLASGATIPIEEVEPGDEVLAFDPLTGEEGPREVTDTITGQGQKTLVDITITDADGDTSTITATDEHPFWAPKAAEWVDAIDLKPGTWLRTSSGAWVQVSAVGSRGAPKQQVYNLSVNELRTYYAAFDDTAVLVHNYNCGGEVRYNGDDLSRAAFQYRESRDIGIRRNVAAVKVKGRDKPIVAQSQGGGYHSEDAILDKLKQEGIDPKDVTALYSERQPCPKCASKLQKTLSDDANVTWSVPWGDNKDLKRASDDLLERMIKRAKGIS